jgi:O-antigen/teichoic acid export membrane protein
MEQRAIAFGTFQAFFSITLLVTVFIQVVLLGHGLVGWIQAHWTVNLLAGILSMLWVAWEYRAPFRFDRLDLLHIWKYSAPLIPHTLAGWGLGMSDRFIVLKFLGAEANGVYTLGYTLGMAIGLLQNAFNLAYGPWLYIRLKADTEPARMEIAKVAIYFTSGMVILALLLGWVGPALARLAGGKAYAGTKDVILWIAISYAVNGVYKLFANFLFYYQKTGLLAITTILAMGVKFWLAFLWIPRFGIQGAAFSTLAAFSISLALVLLWISLNHPLPWTKTWGEMP